MFTGKMVRLVCLLLGLLLAACVAMPGAAPPPSPTVWVMRHLETDDSAERHLTPASQWLAKRLAERLAESGVGAVWVTDTDRARETGAPLARRMGVEVRVYDHADPQGLLAKVAREGVPALIVGHSNTAPDLARRIGAASEQADMLVEYGQILQAGPEGITILRL